MSTDYRLISGKCECYPCVHCQNKRKADHIVYRKMVWTLAHPSHWDETGIAMCEAAANDAMSTGRYESVVPDLK